MDREAEELFGDWSPPQVQGIMQLAVTATCDVSDVRVHRRVSSRRVFKMQMAPCPEALAEVMGNGFGSLVHISPLELGRTARSWREPVPPPPPEDEVTR